MARPLRPAPLLPGTVVGVPVAEVDSEPVAVESPPVAEGVAVVKVVASSVVEGDLVEDSLAEVVLVGSLEEEEELSSSLPLLPPTALMLCQLPDLSV